MARDTRRRQVAWEAARLMCFHDEAEFERARWKAAHRVYGGAVPSGDLPGRREIREELANLQRALSAESPVDPAWLSSVGHCDRFRGYETLLLPLEQVKSNRKVHPEGDVLYHSLQVFELARAELPYDEEFLLAALLHDVGKAINPQDHVAAGLDALDGSITSRTAWLIEHHVEALLLHEGKLGVRTIHRLQADESYAELLLLAQCDRKGHVRGVAVSDVTDALDYVRSLAAEDESAA